MLIFQIVIVSIFYQIIIPNELNNIHKNYIIGFYKIKPISIIFITFLNLVIVYEFVIFQFGLII